MNNLLPYFRHNCLVYYKNTKEVLFDIVNLKLARFLSATKGDSYD